MDTFFPAHHEHQQTSTSIEPNEEISLGLEDPIYGFLPSKEHFSGRATDPTDGSTVRCLIWDVPKH